MNERPDDSSPRSRPARAAAGLRRWPVLLVPLLAAVAILGVLAYQRQSDPLSTGPVLTDNPAGVVEGVDYRPTIDPAQFSTSIDNRFMPMVPGTRRTYVGGDERVVISVTSDTRTVMGIETLVVRDREYRGDTLVEDTADWFAQDADGNVWYFGEDTAECADGQVANHRGAWEAGVDGAQPGIVMLAAPRVGDHYRQEFYQGVAEDVGRVREIGATVDHDGRTYSGVLVTEDFTALEPGNVEYKSYAPGIGLIEERPVSGRGGIRLAVLDEGVDPADPGAGKPCRE